MASETANPFGGRADSERSSGRYPGARYTEPELMAGMRPLQKPRVKPLLSQPKFIRNPKTRC